MIIEEIVGMINTLHKGGVKLLSQDLRELILEERSDHLFDNWPFCIPSFRQPR